MKALSIRQPWAWLILRPDIKDPAARQEAAAAGVLKLVENRTWTTEYRGRILVHAAKGMTKAEYLSGRDMIHQVTLDIPDSFPLPDQLERGGIVGAVDIVGCCITSSSSRWHTPGLIGLLLANPEPLPFRAMPGKLGLFEVPDA